MERCYSEVDLERKPQYIKKQLFHTFYNVVFYKEEQISFKKPAKCDQARTRRVLYDYLKRQKNYVIAWEPLNIYFSIENVNCLTITVHEIQPGDRRTDGCTAESW